MEFTNETCKKIIESIFLTIKAMIIDTHGIKYKIYEGLIDISNESATHF